MTEERKTTALNAPIGVCTEQSNLQYNDIIAQNQGYFNPSAEEIFEAQMQYERENSPSYMGLSQCLNFMKWYAPQNCRLLTVFSTTEHTFLLVLRKSEKVL